MAKVYFSTGSNQGDRLGALVEAAKLIDNLIGKILALSPVVESEPWGFKAEMNFYNQVLLVETDLAPKQIILKILEIEKKMGRKRTGVLYGSRIIDIDILLYENISVKEDDLVIPHPRLHLRRFVLQPLAFLSPGLIHPLLNKTISELLNISEDTSQVRNIVGQDEFYNLVETISPN